MKQVLKKSSVLVVILMLFFTTSAVAEDYLNVPAKGTVTMIDLGAKKCIPCKMMAPIMEKMEKAYKGKADIVFIDVWENRQPAQRFKIRAIPTQIFLMPRAKKYTGMSDFLDEKSIVEQLTKMGVEKPNLNDKG